MGETGAMPAAPRIAPRDVFTPEEWAGLQERPVWMGPALVAHAWGLIALAFVVHALWPNPLTWLLAVMVVGARQLGLAILMHEAAHGGLARSQRLNDWLGQWLCAAPVGADLARYRPYHLRHHRDTQQDTDPDLGLASAFPTTPESLRRKFVRDLTGQTFFRQRIAPLLDVLRGPRADGEASVVGSLDGLKRHLLVSALLWAGLSLAGQGWAFWTIWVVALATWFPLVTRIRNIGEHACATPDPSDPWKLARTTHAGWLERLLIAPYWVHFHAEHHLWMHIPCYRLERAHRLLAAKGITARMEVRSGYREILRLVTAPARPA